MLLPFTAPWLLAPMEGVTEPCYRDLVLAENDAAHLGGAFTEFVRVVDRPLAKRVLLRHLGPRRCAQPVGLQLMGANLEALAETARAAQDAGAPLVDLNFGCPAKGALKGCAGSALLKDPRQVERVVRVVASAVEGLPVTAKIRAGFHDALRIEELARAAEAGGAALLTIHCRTKVEGYQPEVDWTRIQRAVSAISIPVCGNGGVVCHQDLERMRTETGCRFVMVGQGALANPWIFSGRSVDRCSAAHFLVRYAERLRDEGGFASRGQAARVKQLLRHWTAGGLVDETRAGLGRKDWLREDPEVLLVRVARAAESSTLPTEAALVGNDGER